MQNRKTILVVDDTPENIDILTSILRDMYKVKAAMSGERALQVIEKSPLPDMILLDIMMPGMDGYEVLKKIKSDTRTADIPVIFISALSTEQNVEKGLHLGAVDYITKPINPAITIARVQTHLALHERQQELEEKVKEETSKRLEQQKLLLRQSRLAAMGEMMSAITHQWNQPLNVITLTSSSLHMSAELGTLDNEKLLDQLEVVDRTVEFMSQTMLDFKSFLKPEKEQKCFKVAKEVDAVASMLMPILKSGQITLEIEIDEHLTGFGIASEFKQVILNLISNAKDAIIEKAQAQSFQGKIAVQGRQNGDHTVLEVSDNGTGVPQELIDKVFNDYFTTKKDKGTGIGLSMSRMIIEEEMHGKIEVVNLSEGAKFSIEFPATGN